uniref:hypothetical protein n=1 Tax=Rhizobium laguerreae TaxID=1076926 RepID=UPI0036F3DB5E
MSGRTRLYSDQARRQCLEKSNDIVAAQPAAADDRVGTIDPVNLKYLLSDIQTSRPIVVTCSMDGSPHVNSTTTLWHIAMTGAEAVHHIRSGRRKTVDKRFA